MSEEVQTEVQTETKSKVAPPPSPVDMFFRYVASLVQTAGAQAFTLAVAFPKGDGSSAVVAVAGGTPDATDEWKEEVARLLSENAASATKSILPKKAETTAAAE